MLGLWSWNGHSWVTLGKKLCITHHSGLLGHRTLWISSFLLRRRFSNGHLLVTLGKRLCTFIVQVSWHRELFKSVQLYLEDVLKWQATCWWYWGEDTVQLLLGYLRTEHFEAVEFYLDNDLEINISDWHWGTKLHSHCSGLPGDILLQVSTVIFRRCSWNSRPLGADTLGRD